MSASISCVVSSIYFSLSSHTFLLTFLHRSTYSLQFSHSVGLPAKVEIPGTCAQPSPMYPLRSISSALATSCVGAPLPSPLSLSAVPSIHLSHCFLLFCPKNIYRWTPVIFCFLGKMVLVMHRPLAFANPQVSSPSWTSVSQDQGYHCILHGITYGYIDVPHHHGLAVRIGHHMTQV